MGHLLGGLGFCRSSVFIFCAAVVEFAVAPRLASNNSCLSALRLQDCTGKAFFSDTALEQPVRLLPFRSERNCKIFRSSIFESCAGAAATPMVSWDLLNTSARDDLS